MSEMHSIFIRVVKHEIYVISEDKKLWDFQLNSEVAQQVYEDQPSLNLVEILNVSSEHGGESSLNISLEEVCAAAAVEETTVGNDEISRVFRS